MSARLAQVAVMSAVVGVLLGAACQVTFPDTLRFWCSGDEDCGGDGWVCAQTAQGSACCKPSGPDICDGLDNDCDGLVDNSGQPETCNGADDDCDGQVDEGFRLETNPNHCGACNNTCAVNQYCAAGACVKRLEAICYDGVDNDQNGQTDCLDPACDEQQCGTSCICLNLGPAEGACGDKQDNDTDTLTDCLDPDCTGRSCGTGCLCVPDGGMQESTCLDGVDNDEDTLSDCLDPDCLDKLCTPPALYFTCSATQQCKCNGDVQVSEVGSVLCRDGIDNDCDGLVDCQETSCDGQQCPDGGAGCVCGGGGRKEGDCGNGLDDDGDGVKDCGDPDCLAGACPLEDGGVGACGTQTCQ